VNDLAATFRRFAELECAGNSPLYEALAKAIALDQDLLALSDLAGEGQPRPNMIFAAVNRPIDWLHIPVPRARDDDAYFAPLNRLALPPETRLFLGLVHMSDGTEGAARRIAAAEQVVTGFGIGTECGFGRRDSATIPDLLRLHAEVARI